MQSCSNDKEESARIGFYESELKQIDDQGDALYYVRRDLADTAKIHYAYIFPFTESIESLEYAYDAICPNEKIEHSKRKFLIFSKSNSTLHCNQCNANFNTSGYGSNDVAKGLRIDRYNVDYDKSKKYYICGTKYIKIENT